MWFDVEIGYYTTAVVDICHSNELWFDVEIGYYTTTNFRAYLRSELWFDVEIGYYTTLVGLFFPSVCCDLM